VLTHAGRADQKNYICCAARPEESLNLTVFGKPFPLCGMHFQHRNMSWLGKWVYFRFKNLLE